MQNAKQRLQIADKYASVVSTIIGNYLISFRILNASSTCLAASVCELKI